MSAHMDNHKSYFSDREQRKQATFRLSLSAMLLAVMLVLGWLESMLPSLGVPGIKLGLSNSILIFAVYMLDIPTTFILMTLKVVLSGLMFGGVSAMMYAFAGGLMSLTGMTLLHLIPGIHPVPVSMAGGMLHNAGQTIMAILILHTPDAIMGYLGLLMITGLVCGTLTGTAASQVMRHLKSAHWHAPEKLRGVRSLLLVAVSLLCICLGGFFAWQSMHHVEAGSVTITIESLDGTEAPITITDASRPPL
ncbi:MAG: Gx transporter family protein [Clostridia bacterium]|nr:Gx transporter family protein [Clostridia bacterium]